MHRRGNIIYFEDNQEFIFFGFDIQVDFQTIN